MKKILIFLALILLENTELLANYNSRSESKNFRIYVGSSLDYPADGGITKKLLSDTILKTNPSFINESNITTHGRSLHIGANYQVYNNLFVGLEVAKININYRHGIFSSNSQTFTVMDHGNNKRLSNTYDYYFFHLKNFESFIHGAIGIDMTTIDSSIENNLENSTKETSTGITKVSQIPFGLGAGLNYLLINKNTSELWLISRISFNYEVTIHAITQINGNTRLSLSKHNSSYTDIFLGLEYRL